MQTPLRKLLPVISLSLVVSLGLTGCETPGQTALAGAATGAAIGGLVHGRGRDALRGAAIGAGAGYLIGRIAQNRREERYGYDEYPRSVYGGEMRRERARYPIGEPTERRGFVVSPYPPHNLIDVRGIPSGARVMDPSVNRVFIAP